MLQLRSGRGAAILSTIFSALGKSLGYFRTLTTVFFFGASAAMDAFNVSLGIVDLFSGTVRTSIETALLPELDRIRTAYGEEAERSLMAAVWWLCIGISLFFSLLFLLFSEDIIRAFAYGFKGERLSLSVVMLAMLIPFCIAGILHGTLCAWSLHNGKYVVPSLVESLYNPFAIPLLLVLVPVIGPLALPASHSLSWLIRLGIMGYASRGFPWRLSRLPWGSLLKVLSDSFLCLGLVGLGAIFQATDRFFASMLPVGSISIIGYAGFVYLLPLAFLDSPLQIFLAKVSKGAIKDPQGTRIAVGKIINVGAYYLFPVGCFLVAAASPVLRLFFGYGAFTASAVGETGYCLSAYAFSLPFVLVSSILWKYAQSIGRLRVVFWISLTTAFLNVFLDWLFARLMGAPGIALATSLMTFGGTSLCLIVLISFQALRSLYWLCLRILPFSICWALPVFIFRESQPFWILLSAGAALIFQLLLLERMPFFRDLPREWMPREMGRFVGDLLRRKI